MAKFSLASMAESIHSVSNSDTDTQRVEMLSVYIVAPSASNFYRVDGAGIEELADDIRLHGILQPLIVTPDGNSYRLISGHRRRAAAIRAGLSEVPCIVAHPSSPEAEELMLISCNSQARVLTSYEVSRQAERTTELLIKLRDQGVEIPGKLRKVVAEQLNVSESKLARAQAIRRNLAVPGFVRGWESDNISESTAYAISQLPPDQQYRLLDYWIDSGNPLTTKMVAEFVRKQAEPVSNPDPVRQDATEQEPVSNSDTDRQDNARRITDLDAIARAAQVLHRACAAHLQGVAPDDPTACDGCALQDLCFGFAVLPCDWELP